MDRTDETKVVQTEIPTTLYDLFKTIAAAKNMTLKEATREAIADFTDRYPPIETDDPIFAPLDRDDSSKPADPVSETVDTVVYDKPVDGDS